VLSGWLRLLAQKSSAYLISWLPFTLAPPLPPHGTGWRFAGRPRRSQLARRAVASPRPAGCDPSDPTCGLGLAQPLQDRLLDGAGGKRFSRTCCPALALRVQADIIGILSIVLSGVGIHHPRRARFAIEQSAQQGQVFVPRCVRKCRGVTDQILHAFPRAACENGGMLARVPLPFMPDRAGIKNVGQQPQQRVLCKWPARASLGCGRSLAC